MVILINKYYPSGIVFVTRSSKNKLLKTARSILQAVAYFDMFSYPVTQSEIHFFAGEQNTVAETDAAIEILIQEQALFRCGDFYSLKNDPALAERRIRGNAKADELLHIAHSIGKMLLKFPFIEGVGISGSLSKNYADENADIDFFIITKTNRLWISRTLLHLLKKLSFLVGRQHWYCMNYFIDADALQIAEKNIFTATEIVTLKPVCYTDGIIDFFAANTWTKEYFPNHCSIPDHTIENIPSPSFTKWIERMLDNRFGNWLDNRLMKITAGRWLHKEQHHRLNSKGAPLALAVGKHFARPNPGNFQQEILRLYESRLKEIEDKWGGWPDGPVHFLRKEII